MMKRLYAVQSLLLQSFVKHLPSLLLLLLIRFVLLLLLVLLVLVCSNYSWCWFYKSHVSSHITSPPRLGVWGMAINQAVQRVVWVSVEAN